MDEETLPTLLNRSRVELRRCSGDRPELIRVRHNRYTTSAEWNALDGRQKMVLRARAANGELDRPVFSHTTAAALHRIPLLGSWPEHVEVRSGDDTRGRAHGTVRHRCQTEPSTVDLAGLTVTCPAQTAIDVGRVLGLGAGVVAADDVLRRGLATHADLMDRWTAIPKGGRGKRIARTVLLLADARAESPGESLSRVRMYENGFPKPDLQHQVNDHLGLVGFTDFWWNHLRLVGEFDGKLKYRLDSGGADAERLVAEKVREDRIRATDRRIGRWIWSDALPLGADGMCRILFAAGLRADDKPWF